MTTNEILILLLVAVAIAAAVYVVLGARRLKSSHDARVAGEAPPEPQPAPTPSAAPSAVEVPAGESPFLTAADGPADDLMQIKGIGPKLAARLAELGVFHFRQIAGWSPEQLALVDSQLGNFQGRPQRDQWQSQARLLAAGDVKGYERAHGKLGSAPGPAA